MRRGNRDRREPAKQTNPALLRIAALGPAAFGASFRNGWSASGYTAATGNWTAYGGSRSDTMAQGTAGKRPAKTASNAAFGNKPTVDADGIDDDLRVVGQFALALVPNTVGVLFKVNGAGAGNYLVGQYASVSYQFYRADHASDQIITDPSGQTYATAGVTTTHLWIFSKSGTTLNAYRDGAPQGTRTMTSSSGTASDFYVFSAGGGYSQASLAEAFTLDVAVSAAEAIALTKYFRGQGYPV